MINDKNLRSAGLSLIVGSFLMIVTMVLHPVGGGFDHLVKIVGIGIISHAIALFSVPFVAYGYWGITMKLQDSVFLSRIAFSFMMFGLVAVMIAATLNGLVLMKLVQSHADAGKEVIANLKPIIRYNHYFNLANDYIFMTAVGVSTLFWSIAILRTRQFPMWVGYLGIGLVSIALLTIISGFIYTDVSGFRVFIFGTTAWTIAMGGYLVRKI